MKNVLKWIIRGIGLITILFILSGVLAFLTRGCNTAAPGVDKANYSIQTYSQDELRIPSRIYYSQDIVIDGDYVFTKGYYWSFDGEKFIRHKNVLKLDVK